jgi:hypothetical protein
VGTIPGQPPAAPPPGPQTQVAGQQIEPSTIVPHVPGSQLYRPSTTAPTNNLAVVSLVASLLSFVSHVVPVIGGLVVSIVAIGAGHMARRQIKLSGERGMWMATAGMVIGIIHIVLIGIGLLALLFVIFVLGIALFGLGHH